MAYHLSASKRARLQSDSQDGSMDCRVKAARVIPTVRSRSSMVFVSSLKGKEVNVKPLVRLNTRYDQSGKD